MSQPEPTKPERKQTSRSQKQFIVVSLIVIVVLTVCGSIGVTGVMNNIARIEGIPVGEAWASALPYMIGVVVLALIGFALGVATRRH